MTPLRTALKALGMTRAELARELGVTPEQVSRWSTGAKPTPRYALAYLEQRRRRMLFPGFTDAQIEAGLTVPAAREE